MPPPIAPAPAGLRRFVLSGADTFIFLAISLEGEDSCQLSRNRTRFEICARGTRVRRCRGGGTQGGAMLFIVERATSVAQWLFVVYLLVVGVNMYRLFSPPQCSASDPATMCVPSAVGAGDRYDVWVWASPEESFHAIEDFIKGGDYEARTVHAGRAAGSAMDDPQKQAPSSADEESNSRPVELVHAFFGVRLNETVTANVTVPVRRFGTRNNGTLYVHAVLYYPVPKSAAGALYEARNSGWRP
jgi:hypothetical protein